MKRILPCLLCLLLAACAPAPREEPEGLRVVATVFPAYDFARAVGGEEAQVRLLLPPGAGSHSYEPTPADILAVQDCDLFVYLGGESDAWVDTILESVQPRGRVLRMIDCVTLLEEETVEGMEVYGEDHRGHGHGLGEVAGYDEHVWTSPKKAAEVTRALGEELAALDREHSALFRRRAEDYAAQLEELHRRFSDFFQTLEKRIMVFGDRFPLRYFAQEYDLDYYAAFPGCSTQTEPSAATVAFLTDKVWEEEIPVVWYIEFSNHLVADSIAEAAGAETALFHTCHNVSPDQLEAGETYLSLMEKNLEMLEKHMK